MLVIPGSHAFLHDTTLLDSKNSLTYMAHNIKVNIFGLLLRRPFTLTREKEHAFGQWDHICETLICPVYCSCF